MYKRKKHVDDWARANNELFTYGHSEPTPTSAPWKMNDKWPWNSFLLGFTSLANHGGYFSSVAFSFNLPTNNRYKQVVSR
jgi:hypothetical protein